MHPNTRQLTSVILLVFLCVASLTLGCKDSRRHQATDALAMTATALALPSDAPAQDVVTRFLENARDVQHIRESGFAERERQEAYERGMAALHAAVNGPALFNRMMKSQTSRALPAGMTQQAAVTTATESWLSILAHYIDGVRPESIRTTTVASPESKIVVIDVQAMNPDEAEALADLEASPAIRNARDAVGNPIAPNTPAYFALVREKALELEPPLVTPLPAVFEFTLQRASSSEPWGIVSLRIKAPLTIAHSVQPPLEAAPAPSA